TRPRRPDRAKDKRARRAGNRPARSRCPTRRDPERDGGGPLSAKVVRASGPTSFRPVYIATMLSAPLRRPAVFVVGAVLSLIAFHPATAQNPAPASGQPAADQPGVCARPDSIVVRGVSRVTEA